MFFNINILAYINYKKDLMIRYILRSETFRYIPSNWIQIELGSTGTGDDILQ